jgi:dTDP-4-amino-4,6-dideoxygalactose transaminase
MKRSVDAGMSLKGERMEFVNLKAQYSLLKDRIDRRVHKVLDHGGFIMGPEVSELEAALANYVGVNHAISCANGTDALQLALMALGTGPGHAVFTTPFTFFATAEVISLVGATPVFVDIEPDTFNLDPAKLDEAIVKVLAKGEIKPHAAIVVDLFGLPADYDRLEEVVAHHGIDIVEDAAQGFGGVYKGKRAGGFGRVATTSFFPAKPLGCYGDGGAVFTDDDRLAEVIESLRIHGKGHDKYDNVRIGLNSRLDTLQAAILLEKLAVFPDELLARQRVADAYTERLASAVTTPTVPDGLSSCWAQYTVRVPAARRDPALSDLKARGIPTAVYYAKPLHRQTAFLDRPHVAMPCPESEAAGATVFSLPMHPYLEDAEIERVTSAVVDSLEDSRCAS